jgi:hypothetical protein
VGGYGTKSIHEVTLANKKTYFIHDDYGVDVNMVRNVESTVWWSVITIITPTAKEFLEKLVTEQLVKKLLSFKLLEGSLSYPQESTTGPKPELAESCPHFPHTVSIISTLIL